MFGKTLFITVLCVSLGSISCYDHEAIIQEIVEMVEQQLDMFGNSTIMSFYPSQAENVRMYFDSLATSVAWSQNPYAIAHVNNFQKNYTAVPYLVGKMINDTRTNVLKTFTFQRQSFKNLLPQIHETSEDVNDILRSKFCDEKVIEEFFAKLLYLTMERVTNSMSEGYSAYMSQLMSQHAPFMLFGTFTMQLQMCMSVQMEPTPAVTTCMVQKDDLYLSATINLVHESLRSVQEVVENFNLKITDYVVKDVESTFNRAYKDAMMMKC